MQEAEDGNLTIGGAQHWAATVSSTSAPPQANALALSKVKPQPAETREAVSVFPIVPKRTQSLQVFALSDPGRSSKVYYDTIKTKDTSDPDRFLRHWKLALCSCASTLAAPTADREAPRPRWETN